jgi:hypothetical protein
VEEAKNRPVSKVITLLKDMQKQLETEVEQDQEIYDKMACWCTTNDKEKTKSIAEAEQHISELTASIEEGTAKSAQLTTEIANLEKEVAANQQALDKATALRQKQLAEFNAEEKDLLQSIQALGNAVVVLGKHNKSLLQTEASAIPQIAMMLRHQWYKYEDILDTRITPKDKKTIKAFMQSGAVPAYAPQSGEIFGILSNMKDTFSQNLGTSQKEEAANQAAYEDLKAAKQAEISAGQEQIDKKTDELAATDEKLANDKQDLEDTRASLSADEKFLADLKEKCKQTDQEYEARQKTRREEISAVSEALNFLNSDEAHDLFTSTFNGLQMSSSRTKLSLTRGKRERAASILANASERVGSPRLSAIAVSVKLDAFVKVKKAIDDMVQDLLKEKEDEIKHRDFCINGLHENDSVTASRNRDKSDLEAKVAELEGRITELSSAIETLQAEIAETRVQLKRAGEDREKQNLEFQKTVSDQRATAALLNKAVSVLKGFYEKSKGNAFAQFAQPAGPPPPAGFKSYENNASGGGVIAQINQIINDAKAMEAEAIHDEEDSQAAYESFVQESNTTIETKQKQVVNKSEARATAEVDKSQAETELDATVTELEQLANEALDLHKACDFVLKNFEVRQEARDQEVEALRQAKAILSGAK